ncbi:Pre-mRNA-splicing factor ISY1 -like protein [Trichinella britovi]|uniref:Pre-mRNA-splicing factor ISY1-like protein n=1 Tax=Trichinella britovi TaxID=45882 RepID=A0A0V1DJE2_TRIBR|nr:Pre-mRNA-splicing factor ISY1 -like protein [Trichinella britovi]
MTRIEFEISNIMLMCFIKYASLKTNYKMRTVISDLWMVHRYKRGKMARNAEKALTALARWRKMKLDEERGPTDHRPALASECNDLRKAEVWRLDVIREIARKIAQIQNPGLGEFKIRDLNDEINKLLKTKYHWEVRVRELGGPDYKRIAPKMLDREGRELPGNRGYKYFGAAKDLPGVRELFAKPTSDVGKLKKTYAQLVRAADARYYGYVDEDDGVILPLEYEAEAAARKKAVEEWEKNKMDKFADELVDKVDLPTVEDIGNFEEENAADILFPGDDSTDRPVNVEDVSTGSIPVPSQEEVEQAILKRKKMELLEKYASESLMKQSSEAKSLMGFKLAEIFAAFGIIFHASMLISKKAGELFSKAIQAKSDWTDKDDLLDVIYWFKQIFSLLFGIGCGLLPVEGFSVIAFYLMVSTLVTHFYITAFQCFDEDELGGISEVFKEGFSSAFATFMNAFCLLNFNNFEPCEIVFVYVTEPIEKQGVSADLLKEKLIRQTNFTVHVYFTHSDFSTTTGAWAIWPILHNKLQAVQYKWLFFMESQTVVDLMRLTQLLAKFDPAKQFFIGHALIDHSMTIIHHFSSEKLKYPELGAGFVISKATFNFAVELVKSNESNAQMFIIDAMYELALLLYNNSFGVELTDEPMFCTLAEQSNCITRYVYDDSKCTGNVSSEDVVFAVKTWSGNHQTRIPILKQTWVSNDIQVIFFSDVEDRNIPTVKVNVENTKEGHCEKTLNILQYFNEINNRKYKWIVLADDDTLFNVAALFRLLRCYNSESQMILGQRYGFHFNADGTRGFDYPTLGAGAVFSSPVVSTLAFLLQCTAKDAPDDMSIGFYLSNTDIPIVHSSSFHQAPSSSYAHDYLHKMPMISFHSFFNGNPLENFERYLKKKHLRNDEEEHLAKIEL